MKVHLLGDSLVASGKWFGNEFHEGWGDCLAMFLSEDMEVLNYAIGGRSCRSFLNEGRFCDNGMFSKDRAPYGLGPALPNIQTGDYVLISFMHNDDDTHTSRYRLHRQVDLGKPDENGIYPMIVPEESMKVSVDYHLEDYPECLYEEGFKEKEVHAILKTTANLMAGCGKYYYPYDCGATYKGYFKYYIDKIREKGAFPVIVSSVVKHRFENHVLKPEPCIRGNWDSRHEAPYVEAQKQLSQELQVPFVDINKGSQELLTMLGEKGAENFRGIVVEGAVDADSESQKGDNKWPDEYDRRIREMDYTQLDITHPNHFGAFVCAAMVADMLKAQHILEDKILTVPKEQISMPERLQSRKEDIAAWFTNIDLFGTGCRRGI